MDVRFPYDDIPGIEIPDRNLIGIFSPAQPKSTIKSEHIIEAALQSPVGSAALRKLVVGKRSVLIVCDDVSRPTPAWDIIPSVLKELKAAGVEDSSIEFMMALGTHRPMTEDEMRRKVGADVFERYRVINHEWDNPDALEYAGKTHQGVEVWINRKVSEADLVIGIGRIMPIDICGFTGGGKILIPGCCGEITNSEMHWGRTELDSDTIIGRRDNPVRESIDEMARQAGLDFIVNVILDLENRIVDCVAGDLVQAHRVGCELARAMHEVTIPREADIDIVDGHPFDIEFWQVNKAVDTAGLVVRPGGIVICISPCHEGFSRSHDLQVLEFGYRPVEEIKRLVQSGRLQPKVVGVHMIQVSAVAVEKAKLILVTNGIPPADVRKAGLDFAATPQEALDAAFAQLGTDAKVIVLRGAAEMLPVIESRSHE